MWAVAFLAAARAGDAAALRARVAPDARHQNAHCPAGMDALIAAMADAAGTPRHRHAVQRVVAEGAPVVAHFQPAAPRQRTSSGSRGERSRKCWASAVPADVPDDDGLF